MSIYQNLYDLIQTYIFGGVIDPGSYSELVAILCTTIGCLFCLAIPFVVVGICIYFICKTILTLY